MTYSLAKVARIYLQQNEAILNDDYFGIQHASIHKFMNIEKTHVDTTINPSLIVGIGLMLGPNKITYSRNVFTIMELFGNVGGVYGILHSI